MEGVAFTAASSLTTGPWRRRNQHCLYLVGSPEEELRLRLPLSLVPGRTRPSPGGDRLSSHCLRQLQPPWRALVINVYNIRRGGPLCLQVLAPGPWVVGAPRGRTMAASWWRLRQSETPGEGRLCHQVVAMGVAKNSTSTVSIAAPGYMVGPERYSTYAPTTTASSQWRPRQ